MEKRYQVFVSSTYTDLVEERSEVMQALLELECMPAGMELFPAANDTQWEWIRKVIDESDYYIVLIGGRYGSISKQSQLSYTEMEYQYAVEIGIPILGFIREDPENIPSKHSETSDEKIEKLQQFKDFVKTRLCKFYNSPSDLGAKVSRSVTQMKKQYPAIGWIRANKVESIASAEEQLKLSRENEELKNKLFSLEKGMPLNTSDLASGSDLYSVSFTYTIREKNKKTNRLRNTGNDTSSVDINWDDIFKGVGPRLLTGGRRYWGGPSFNLIDLVVERARTSLFTTHPNAKTLTDFAITNECNQTIYMQLRALQFIDLNEEGEWELTSYGDKYLSELFAVKKQDESL